jgi:hypothetical protein
MDGRVEPSEVFGRYRDATFTDLELEALEWLEGFYELEHLLATRLWAIRLRPNASAELRLAALVHDCERHFPGGPTNTPARFDDPGYLFAHSIRSGEFIERFLEGQSGVDEDFRYRVKSLVTLHEVGGDVEADVLQAADSLSFLETLRWLTVQWVQSGRYDRERAKEKHRYMLKRMRPPEALAFGLPFYELAMRDLDNAESIDITGRLEIASDYRLLIGAASTVDRPRGES